MIKLKSMKLDSGQKVSGVKHEKCAQTNELKCIVCGSSAGCSQCEFQDICDIPNVSQLCICKKCGDEKNAYDSYQKSSKKKFPILNS